MHPQKKHGQKSTTLFFENFKLITGLSAAICIFILIIQSHSSIYQILVVYATT
jgi:hypothetical protein